MDSITILDDLWMGRPHTIATALLESGGHHAVIDPGPGSTLATLREQLETRGLGVGDLEAVLLTHIHLDHAGATGALVRHNPRLVVHVHKNGAPHMIDPSKLLASAERQLGQKLQPGLSGYWHWGQKTADRSAPQYGHPALLPLSILLHCGHRNSPLSVGRDTRYTSSAKTLPMRVSSDHRSGRGTCRCWASM